jgi:hypothetical protein
MAAQPIASGEELSAIKLVSHKAAHGYILHFENEMATLSLWLCILTSQPLNARPNLHETW